MADLLEVTQYLLLFSSRIPFILDCGVQGVPRWPHLHCWPATGPWTGDVTPFLLHFLFCNPGQSGKQRPGALTPGAPCWGGECFNRRKSLLRVCASGTPAPSLLPTSPPARARGGCRTTGPRAPIPGPGGLGVKYSDAGPGAPTQPPGFGSLKWHRHRHSECPSPAILASLCHPTGGRPYWGGTRSGGHWLLEQSPGQFYKLAILFFLNKNYLLFFQDFNENETEERSKVWYIIVKYCTTSQTKHFLSNILYLSQTVIFLLFATNTNFVFCHILVSNQFLFSPKMCFFFPSFLHIFGFNSTVAFARQTLVVFNACGKTYK